MASVLVVDDEWLVREEFASNLQDAGFDVLQAEDGLVALRTLQQHTPSVVVTDFMMPKMNGLDLARALRNTPKSGTPIILRSGHSEGFPREHEKLFAGIYDKSDVADTVLDHVAALVKTAEQRGRRTGP